MGSQDRSGYVWPWLATGTLLGAVVPGLGMAVIAAFVPYYWLPIRGELARAWSRRHGGRS